MKNQTPKTEDRTLRYVHIFFCISDIFFQFLHIQGVESVHLFRQEICCVFFVHHFY